MTPLNRHTCRRLKKLRQTPTVWEGDRYPLQQAIASESPFGPEQVSDCVLWVDGSNASIRAMEMVNSEVGHEAVVRVLLRAMEAPSSNAEPTCPQRILVRSRELQFFLRGVLQDLDITVEYAEDLPIVDEILHSLESYLDSKHPHLPPTYAEPLMDTAMQIWHDAPWAYLDEEKIIAVHLHDPENDPDVETLYLSFLGMLGVEFGVLMYRSQESLKTFRQRVLALSDSSPELLEEAFLQQDCLFLTFETSPHLSAPSQSSLQPYSVALQPGETLDQSDVSPEFGNLHPLEGMRPNLYEEEAQVLLVALNALHRFFQTYQETLKKEEFPEITAQYHIDSPDEGRSGAIEVQIATMPQLARELGSMVVSEAAGAEPQGEPTIFSMPILSTEMVPSGTLSQIGYLPWEMLVTLRASTKMHQAASNPYPTDADGFPIVLLQTSRPKAMKLMDAVQDSGGLNGIGFTAETDTFNPGSYDLGLLQTRDGMFHVFGEYEGPTHARARQKWDERCRMTQGCCGLIIAKGVTGAARGNPSLKDMLALFEVRSLLPKDLGFSALRLMPYLGSE